MLAEQEAWKVFQTLPPDEKRKVVDFIAHLQSRHGQPPETDTGITQPQVSPLGAMQGLIIHMSEDFDAALDDFSEYMT